MADTGYIYHEEAGGPDGPLVFLFHGTGGNEHQLTGLGRQLVPTAQIVSPRGDVSEGGALRFFRRTGEGVYDMADLARATTKMSAFVREKRMASGRSPVIGLGYSNGANILATTLIEAPELWDVAVLMHPLIPFAPPQQPALSGKRVLVTAGRRDPICPPEQTQALVTYLEEQGAAIEVFWHPGGHEVGPGELEAVARFLGTEDAR